MFWYRWPSPVTEGLSGLLTASLAQVVGGQPWGPLIAAHALSVFYEARLDPNGWSMTDVLQREVGILIGLGVWALIRR